MNLRKDNRIIVDLNKCQFARFYYRNKTGHTRNVIPPIETFNNQIYSPQDRALFHPNYPNESLVNRLKRRGIQPDVWTPEVLLKLSANHCLIYTGEKAVSIYKTWCEKVFNKKKKD